MDNIETYGLQNRNASLFTESEKHKLREVLGLLRGIWSLPLENEPEKAEEIRSIFGEAEKREKK